MPENVPARIAVLADTSLQRHVLQQALTANGYRVVLNNDPVRLDEGQLAACETELWIVDLAQSEESPLVDALLEFASVPVLFGAGQAPERHSEHYPRWERRLMGKLKRLVGVPAQGVGPSLAALLDEAQRPACLTLPGTLASQAQPTGEPARQVWLLAASMGGPEAVKAFLDALPSGLPLGFVYAQHIDSTFETLLPQAVGRHSQWTVGPVRPGEAIRCGEVVVAPVGQELEFDGEGLMRLAGRPWPEPYSPSIDQMMLNLAQCFGERCGVIVFSGMGSDGSAAALYLRRQGGQIWTQRADTCACSSMPDNLREGGFSALTAAPRDLAQALVNLCAEQAMHARHLQESTP